MSTETKRLISDRVGAQDGHPDFHTAPELYVYPVLLYVHRLSSVYLMLLNVHRDHKNY